MLHRSIYDNNTVADRLLQHLNRGMRSDTASDNTTASVSDQKLKEKKHDTVVKKLEEVMNAMTDPDLLRKAQEDQRGELLLCSPV